MLFRSSAQWVCPHSMIPDVIEYDELMTGERREGVYYGVHATSGKITGALASAACGWGLELGGYLETLEPGQSQPDAAVFAIRVMFALIPAFFLLVCVPLLRKACGRKNWLGVICLAFVGKALCWR